MTLSADYIVVGGGVVGAATAFHLALSGSVVLLEGHTIASGASGGPGKRGVRASGRDIRELPLAQRAYELWPTLADTLEADIGYERVGRLSVLETDEASPTGQTAFEVLRAEVQESFGIPTIIKEAQELDDLQPGLAKHVKRGLYCPLDGIVDHTATTMAFANAAKRRGADIQEHAWVERVSAEDAVHLRGQRDPIVAKKGVLIACNAHINPLLQRSFGLSLPLYPFNPQMNFVTSKEPLPINTLVSSSSRPVEIKNLGNHVYMISGGRMGGWNEKEDHGYTLDTSFDLNYRDACAILPILSQATFLHANASRQCTQSYDGIPTIDCVPGTNKVIMAAGWSGHGFAISPAVAEAIAAWMITGEKSQVLEPFNVDRWKGMME
ncbi:hypothetical protein BZG36_03588 [Bifiguratus adelaidae]|uniref:FAD dependent oxidoreductase domain-containing protein n=1 Tax=Bifiguratus adelaidae TaxID=1938954 RepID=A0A261XYL7_9FUNG|nr:hypothetical protein BZG36_03588 [Bifiguratus adelaidae]